LATGFDMVTGIRIGRHGFGVPGRRSGEGLIRMTD